jgi:hypothetical protein
MMRSFSLRSRCAAASTRASAEPAAGRVVRARPSAVDRARPVAARERLAVAEVRPEDARVDFPPPEPLPADRALRDPLAPRVLRDPLLELDLLDPPLLDCGMVPPRVGT